MWVAVFACPGRAGFNPVPPPLVLTGPAGAWCRAAWLPAITCCLPAVQLALSQRYDMLSSCSCMGETSVFSHWPLWVLYPGVTKTAAVSAACSVDLLAWLISFPWVAGELVVWLSYISTKGFQWSTCQCKPCVQANLFTEVCKQLKPTYTTAVCSACVVWVAVVFPRAPVMMEGVFGERPTDQRQSGQWLLSAFLFPSSDTNQLNVELSYSILLCALPCFSSWRLTCCSVPEWISGLVRKTKCWGWAVAFVCCALVGGLWFVGVFEAGAAAACAAAWPGDACFTVQGSLLWFRFAVPRNKPPTAPFKTQIWCFCMILGCVNAWEGLIAWKSMCRK